MKKQSYVQHYNQPSGPGLFKWHNTILVMCFLSLASAVPVEACEVIVEVEKTLKFGEIVSPTNYGASGWAKVDLDGSYSLSSTSLYPSVYSKTAAGVSLGQLRIRVENAKPGSSIAVRLTALSQRFTLIPNTVQSFQLHTNATKGDFRLDFGGQLLVENKLIGSVVSDIEVSTTCIGV